ncbi:RluA family pseudouridine synthase [Candidatus Uhrbacteria bacterium]|nr:RluA family pseudouridine synthase [Candidatus Uhrbacteria bacterium]
MPRIVFEDASLLVLEKPCGMLVHPTHKRETDTLIDFLTQSGRSFVGIIHRLDASASGLLVVALHPHVAQDLKHQFQQHSITKEYVVLVHGVLPRDEGSITLSIQRSMHKARMAAVPAGSGREARSDYLVMGRSTRYTLVKVRTLTGRTHQVRLHFFALGHPVAGDPLYRSKRWNDDAPRLFLHAITLGFQHPVKKEYMEFHSELPEELQQYLEYNKITALTLEPRTEHGEPRL